MKPDSSNVGRAVLAMACALLAASCDGIDMTPVCDPGGIDVLPSSTEARVGERVAFQATGFPVRRCDEPPLSSTEVRWTSSDSRIVTVDATTGSAVAVSAGRTTVIARSVADQDIQGAAAIVVNP